MTTVQSPDSCKSPLRSCVVFKTLPFSAKSGQSLAWQPKAQNCANILWALVRQERDLDLHDFAKAIAARASNFSDWDEQSLSISVWALAVLGQRTSSLPLLKALTSDLEELRKFSSESLSVFAWTCGLLGVETHPTPLLALVINKRAESLTIEHLSSMLIAFARIWPNHKIYNKIYNYI